MVGKLLDGSDAISTLMTSDNTPGAAVLGAQLSTQRGCIGTQMATPFETGSRVVSSPFVFIARLGGGAVPFHNGLSYDGVETTAPTVLAQHDFVQPMLGRQASGLFAHAEIYLCGVYEGWLSAAGAARLTDHARGTYALRNF